MTTELAQYCWPVERLGHAIEALARASGLAATAAATLPDPGRAIERGTVALGAWIEAASALVGCEAEPVSVEYPNVAAMLARCGPALVAVESDGGLRVAAVLGRRGRGLVLLGPDLRARRVPISWVRAALCDALESPREAEIDRLLVEVGVARRRRARVRSAILGERLASAVIDGIWVLRLPPQASVRSQARREGLTRKLVGALALHGAEYGLWIAAWALIGAAALGGRFEPGWLIGWGLLLGTLVLLRIVGSWWQGTLAIGAGTLLKRRVLRGALSLDPEEIRKEGAGHLLGRVIEAGAVETLAMSGGLLSLTATVEIALAALVLASGAGGAVHAVLLLGWVATTLVLAFRYYVGRRAWTRDRLALTNDLVERMVGHRTRLAQEAPERWHAGEDESIARYTSVAEEMDRRGAALSALAARGWRVVGLIGLVPAFLAAGPDAPALAIGLGGVVLAHTALLRLTSGVSSLVGAAIAWEQVAPLFDAATRDRGESPDSLAMLAVAPEQRRGENLLEAREIVFRHRKNGEPVLKGCSLKIRRGERVLLDGASGGGKSTLASVLTGQRTQESGLLLLGGLDPRTIGPALWRRRVAMVPQFHENHVLTETFAFNLLFGRAWPPSQSDLDEAEAICRNLGLDDLLERMPGGLQQMVGESGWQLSHGERSRLFIARALLQGADLVVLDESFAALDPENLHRALGCVLDKAPALLVIAHP